MQSLLFYPGRTGTDEMERMSLASIKCRDLAMDCSFEAKGTTEREIIRQLIEHTESAPNIPVLTADALYRLKKGIKKKVIR
ncbi:MAG: DUF1059 domain-containing protein [Methanoregula sp.]|nr:DUF1059 domain-containing protein [Methanoregula sp.]